MQKEKGREASVTAHLRLPQAMQARAEALRSRVAAAPEMATLPNVTYSDVLRFALLRGLEALEREFPEG